MLHGVAPAAGCHSDAHEQAKWFGDDVALKASKYKYELRDPRGAAATLGLTGGRGNPPLHRFRVGLEFAISGRRDLESRSPRPSANPRRLYLDHLTVCVRFPPCDTFLNPSCLQAFAAGRGVTVAGRRAFGAES